MNFLKSLAAVLVIALVEYLAGLYFPALLYMDLFLLFAVYVGLIAGPLAAEYSGFLAGITQDILGHSPVPALGINGFSKTVLGFAVSLTNRYLVLDSTWLRLLTVLCASFFNSAIIGSLLYILGQSVPARFAQTALVQAACASAAAAVLFRVTDRIRRGTLKQLARPYAD